MRIHVQRTIAGPPEPIFDQLADHAHYDRFRDIRDAELLKEGERDRNGVGAVRRVRIGPLRFEEDITAFEPPNRLDYLIIKHNTPFDHRGGSIRLTPEGSSTRVDWTSEFHVPVPVIGRAADLVWAVALRRGFRRVLEDVERNLRAPEPSRP